MRGGRPGIEHSPLMNILHRMLPALALFCAPPMNSAPATPIALRQSTVQDERPEIAARLEKLDAHLEKRGKEDGQAVMVIRELGGEFGKSGPKDKAAIVKALAKCFDEKRLENKKGEVDVRVHLAAAEELGGMGPESTPALIAATKHKGFLKDGGLKIRIVLSLGQTHDKRAVPTLFEALKSPSGNLAGAAAQALSEFDFSDLEMRREIVEAMIKAYTTAKGLVDSSAPGTPENAQSAREYSVIVLPFQTALARLTHHEEQGPDEWRRWWNNNKRADWDAKK